MQRSIFCLLVLLCSAFQSYAQDTDYRPNLIPPSPDASALGKYAEHPVGLHTGTLPVVIPIHSVTDGSLQVPINLSYHAAGNKVEEAASFVGLGFTLNAGGAIMRSVRNLPDDYPTKGFLDYTATYSEDYLTNNPNRFTQLEEIAKGCGDTEPDAYFFNFNGHTGSFTFDWNGQLNVYSKVAWKTQILRLDGGNPDKITGWKFTSDDGTVYTLDIAEQATITNNGLPCQAGISYNSAWYLSRITSPNGGRMIDFTYENYTQNFNTYSAVTHRVFCYPSTPSGCQYTPLEPTMNLMQMVYACRRVKTIATSNNATIVTFNYLTTRTDEPGTGVKQLDEVTIKNKDAVEIRKFAFTYDYITGRLSLRSVKKALTDEPPYKFDYSPYYVLPPRSGNGTSILSLSQDHWGYYNGKTDNANLLPPVWKPDPFNPTGPQKFYKGGDREPARFYMEAGMLTKITNPSGAVEAYGYQAHEYGYIGNQSLPDLGEFQLVDNIFETSAFVDIDGDLNLEQTDYIHPVVSGTASDDMVYVHLTYKGLKPPVGDAYVEIYKYGSPSTLYYKKAMRFQLGQQIEYDDFVRLPTGVQYTVKAYAKGRYVDNHPETGQIYYSHAEIKLTWTTQTTTSVPLKKKMAGGVRIAEVTTSTYAGDPSPVKRQYEYHDGIPLETSSGYLNEKPIYAANNLKYYAAGEVACNYDLRIAQNKAILGYGPYIAYGRVSELSGYNGSNGKVEYSYYTLLEAPSTTNVLPPFEIMNVNNFSFQNLNSESIFKKQNDQYIPVRESTFTGDRVYQLFGTIGTIKVGFEGGSYNPSKFHLGYTTIRLGVWDIIGTTVKEYATDGVAYQEKRKSYSYYDQRIATESASAGGDLIYDEMEYYYPDHFTNPTTAVQSLITKNCINTPLEIVKKRVKNSTVVYTGGAVNTYALDGTRVFPFEEKKLQLASPSATYDYAYDNAGGSVDSRYSIENIFEKYDAKENLVQQTGKDGVTKSYLFSKHNEGCVVRANGAGWDKIAWSGFENTDPIGYGGIWNFNSGTYNTIDFYTGKRSFNGTVSVNTTGFPATSYVVSFWMKGSSGNFVVNGTINVPATSTWTLYETRINGGGTVTVVVPAGGLMDELRIYPADAKIATFAYDQLVGMSSAADVKNKPVFSEYDNLWRLHLVKDHNKDIVKRTNYEFEILAPLAYTLTATQTGNYTYQFQVVGGSTGFTYEFDFDDLSAPVSGAATSATRTFSALTLTYNVKVKVKNSVNTLATLTKQVTVQKTGGPSSACNEVQNILVARSTTNTKQVTFTVPTISGVTYWWDFGDNTSATTASAIKVYPTTPGTVHYPVSVTVSTGGKSCTARTSVKINP